MFAFYFPPGGGVGSFRVMKNVKYLRKFGWEPVVVTAKEYAYPWCDYGLMKNIPPDTHIYRLPVFKTCVINDKAIRWIPYVLRSVSSIIKKEKPAVVYLTGGPFLPLILGPIIKKWFKLPYVVDLRDPWKLRKKAHAINGIKARTGKLLTDVLEPFIIRNACRVVCATEPLCQAYIASYKNEQPNKFITITNGYDPEDFEDILPVQFEDYTVVYTGKWYSKSAGAFSNIRNFFKAMGILKKKGVRIKLVHVGIKDIEIERLAIDMEVSNLITFIGSKPYDESLAFAKGANLLFVIDAAREFGLPVKVFDYAGCKRPILALAASDGMVAEVVKKIPFARLISHGSPKEIAIVLEEMYREKCNDIWETENMKCYEREILAHMLAGVLGEASNQYTK